MSKLINKFKKKVVVLASVMLVLQPLLGLAVLPAKTFANTLGTEVVINEVQTGSTTNNDFIELYNPTNSPFDLNGHRLVKRASSSTTDTTIKAWVTSTIIPAHGYYLWANSSYATIPTLADTTTAETITDNKSIALRNGVEDTGTIIDSVGWGTVTNIFVETAAATNPTATQSIERTDGVDTNNNANDFSNNPTPTPRNSSYDVTPPTVVDLTTTSPTKASPILNWTASTDTGGSGVASYKLYRSTSSGTLGSLLNTVVAPTLTYADTSLDPTIVDHNQDGTYYYTVHAVDNNGNENTSTVQNPVKYDTTAPTFTSVVTPKIAGPGVKTVDITITSREALKNSQSGGHELMLTVNEPDGTLVPVYLNHSGSNLTRFEYTYTIQTVGNKTVRLTVDGEDLAGNGSFAFPAGSFQINNVVLSPVVTTPTVVTAVATVPVDEQFGGDASSEQGEVKADTAVKTDNGNNTENKDNQKDDVKAKKNIPLWGIIFLLILAGVGGYLFYSQNPDKPSGRSNGKK